MTGDESDEPAIVAQQLSCPHCEGSFLAPAEAIPVTVEVLYQSYNEEEQRELGAGEEFEVCSDGPAWTRVVVREREEVDDVK